ncbi:MAG: hypothetical protein FJZ89_04015 [Chloroflexi bacterium]|nr:hypothetical protein [Chloroflexota bacterium]
MLQLYFTPSGGKSQGRGASTGPCQSQHRVIASAEAEALSRSEGEAISLLRHEGDCFAPILPFSVMYRGFVASFRRPSLRSGWRRDAPLKRHHALLPETAVTCHHALLLETVGVMASQGVMALHRNDSQNDFDRTLAPGNQ